MYKLIRTLLPVLAAVIATTVSAQSVSWKSSVQHLDGQTYRIVLEASIPAPWHMYDMGPYEGGPNATTITFTPDEGAVLEGGVEQLTRPERHYDKTFGMEIGTFARKAQFAQSVKLTAPQATVKAELAWMICNDTSCLPPDDTELTITLPAGATPAVQPAETPAKESAAAAETVPAAEIAPAQKDAAGGGSLWGLIIEAILWGFAALLTPCVFPMVPMTVSFFMKGSGSPALGRIRAGMYGFFIVALYTLPIAAIILITRLVGGDAVTADIFNWLATHWLPNLIFFIVFMIFAASFFGAFEITLPSWMVNKSDRHADKGGLIGIFFMALTLVLVSFSCTGPIVGNVLIRSTAGEFWVPIVTMFAFSLAFALPFTIFAFFPSLLKDLPKSGGWLGSVKVVLGFIEVALGFKFLSMADQTYHWGLLDREVYLAIWIVVFTLLGFYLLGKIRFAHDDELKHVSVTRLTLAIASLSFAVYMFPGMFGAPLKALSGYLPPMHTQDFVINTQGVVAAPSATAQTTEKIKYADILHWPYDLPGYFDLAQAEAAAREADKPLFVDITGISCVNCREMEARVWSDPRVQQILRDDYVLVALYTDDKTKVPENEWVTTAGGKVLKDIGRINSYIAQTRFGVNGQPNYLILGRDGQELVPKRAYNLDVEAYIDFLKSGVEAYNKTK